MISRDVARIHELIIESRGDAVEIIIFREPRALGAVVSASELMTVLAELTTFVLKPDSSVSPDDKSVEIVDVRVLRSLANSLRLQFAKAISSARDGKVNEVESGKKYVDLLQRLTIIAREMLEIANSIEELLPKIREEAAEAYRSRFVHA